MNLYLDTSALVKLYVREESSAAVAKAVRQADVVVVSRIAYPEARAAIGRRKREHAISAAAARKCVVDLDHDMLACFVVEFTAQVARQAGELAERLALRGFDAIHVASAIEFGRAVGQMPTFVAFDVRLLSAAASEGMATLP